MSKLDEIAVVVRQSRASARTGLKAGKVARFYKPFEFKASIRTSPLSDPEGWLQSC